MRFSTVLPAAAAALLLVGLGASAAQTPAARVSHPPLNEMSGIVKSRRYPDVFWVHNDSGDAPRLFAVRADGTVVMPAYLSNDFFVGDTPVDGKKPYPGVMIDGAANSDWEDITLDNDTLYIADLGNNGNARRDLAIYTLPEPNPEATQRAHVLKRLPVAYPDQSAFPDPARWHFDCEAVFVYNGRLHVVTKHRAPGKINTPETGANLYRLDSPAADRVNVLKKLDTAPDLGGWVTGANVSPDNKTLAVLCQAPVASVWLFDLGRTSGDRLLSGRARRLILSNAQQCEAVCFADNETLLVTNEQRDVFRLKVADFVPAAQP